ncbi:GTP-binding domain [Erwinia phage PhiEaH1]|jgi:hypothetical protein|uniref:YspA cpYpsA-related SLOG domain-containing protein n=1 Tax=Erwinia phage PhiEaH1 TaxID=1401669 RepID=W8D0I9_9CAUD|nr:GTP-binding domain [Erwinia phage PhiEaH1]AGX01893.1 hypothetical protein [Erwinia phage PhiEaH1]WBF04916.1 hypothetical protein [Erwinia phage vB_Ea277G]
MDLIYVMVSGCRHYTSYWQFAKRMDHLLKNFDREKVVLIEGGARGTDYLAYLYARRRKLAHATYDADWDEHGKSAGYIRNAEMMEIARYGVAFWDGYSRGTGHVVKEATKYDVSLRVVKIPEENPNGKKRRGNGAWRAKNGRVVPRDR